MALILTLVSQVRVGSSDRCCAYILSNLLTCLLTYFLAYLLQAHHNQIFFKIIAPYRLHNKGKTYFCTLYYVDIKTSGVPKEGNGVLGPTRFRNCNIVIEICPKTLLSSSKKAFLHF